MTKREAAYLGTAAAREINAQKYKNRINKYNLDPTKCINCNANFIYAKRSLKFCNRSCAASYNNKGVRRHGNSKRKCISCNNQITKFGKIYCSLKCMNIFTWNKWKENIERIGRFEGYSPEHSGSRINRIKKFYIEKYGHSCMICNTKHWQEKPIPLILDHINGKSDNWSLDNLRIICPNCDALLPTYGGRNRGNGIRTHKVFIKMGA